MKRQTVHIIWGVCLILLGLIGLVNVLGILHINLFFDGWWTLFIIIPSCIGLTHKGSRLTSIIFLLIGVLLLLSQQNIITGDMVWGIILAGIIMIIGISVIVSGKKSYKGENMQITVEHPEEIVTLSAIFGGQQRKFLGRAFRGANLTAVFGGVELDLRDAVIESDIIIHAISVFGGCDILVPANVNVDLAGLCIFGGNDDKVGKQDDNSPTIHIKSTSIFGGLEVK